MLAAHIGDERQAPRACLPDFLGDAFDVAPAGGLLVVRVAVRVASGAGQDDVGAGLGEKHSNRAPNTPHAPRTGDDRDLARQFFFHGTPPAADDTAYRELGAKAAEATVTA